MLKHAGTNNQKKNASISLNLDFLRILRAAFATVGFLPSQQPPQKEFDFSSKELSLDLEPKQRTAADQDGLPFNPGVALGGAIFITIDGLRDSESENLLGFSCFSSNSFWLFGAEFSSMSSVLAI